MSQEESHSIALEVRGISTTLQNIDASRKRHDEKTEARFEKLEEEIKKISDHISGSKEFRRQQVEDFKAMKDSILELTALSNRARGSWGTIMTLGGIFAALGGVLTYFLDKVLNK